MCISCKAFFRMLDYVRLPLLEISGRLGTWPDLEKAKNTRPLQKEIVEQQHRWEASALWNSNQFIATICITLWYGVTYEILLYLRQCTSSEAFSVGWGYFWSKLLLLMNGCAHISFGTDLFICNVSASTIYTAGLHIGTQDAAVVRISLESEPQIFRGFLIKVIEGFSHKDICSIWVYEYQREVI